MTLQELKTEISKYQYFEDTKFIDASLACIIASRLSLGNPLWLILIGASSSGKTQLLRPLAMTDPKYIHSVDDLTENTFLSGYKPGKGETVSLLQRIGPKGIMVISDLTGIFSKAAETRGNILGQLRMIYDGEMVKYVGTSSTPISWKGELSVLAGATPIIYKHFEQAASFGERFLHYRLGDYDREKATHLTLDRIANKDINGNLSEMYGEYIKEIVTENSDKEINISVEMKKTIVEIASICEMLRVSGEFDFKTEFLMRIPIPAMPMRTALQLMSLAKGLQCIDSADTNKNREIIEWCGYSLVNDERRACLKILASVAFESSLSTSQIADQSGLPTTVVRMIMQIYSAIKIVERSGDGSNGLLWIITKRNIYDMVRRIEKIDADIDIRNRTVTMEEKDEIESMTDSMLENF